MNYLKNPVKIQIQESQLSNALKCRVDAAKKIAVLSMKTVYPM